MHITFILVIMEYKNASTSQEVEAFSKSLGGASNIALTLGETALKEGGVKTAAKALGKFVVRPVGLASDIHTTSKAVKVGSEAAVSGYQAQQGFVNSSLKGVEVLKLSTVI